jgi:hypothetical protein
MPCLAKGEIHVKQTNWLERTTAFFKEKGHPQREQPFSKIKLVFKENSQLLRAAISREQQTQGSRHLQGAAWGEWALVLSMPAN